MRALLACALLAACRPAVTARLVDGRTTSTPWQGLPFYQVEVHRNPVSFLGLDRFLTMLERVDTVPFIRTSSPIVILGDTAVFGLYGYGQGLFRYDVRSKVLTRSAAPDWLLISTPAPPPAFAPNARYVAYLTELDNGTVRLAIRSWPSGAIIGQSQAFPFRTPSSQPGAIRWRTNDQFLAGFPVVGDSGKRMWQTVGGRIGANEQGIELSGNTFMDATAAPAEPIVAQSVPVHPAAEVDSIVTEEFISLPLSAFPELPSAFVRELEGCVIPQTEAVQKRHNVIHGTFAAPDQLDWAVLCLQGDESVIRVWWGGPARCPSEIKPFSHRVRASFVARVPHGTWRLITTTDVSYGYAEGRTGFVKLEHDAIDDAIVDKASTIWICRNGDWIMLPGAD